MNNTIYLNNFLDVEDCDYSLGEIEVQKIKGTENFSIVGKWRNENVMLGIIFNNDDIVNNLETFLKKFRSNFGSIKPKSILSAINKIYYQS